MNTWEIINSDPWKRDIILASVPMWKYSNNLPVANASGCIIDYAGERFILSVAHSSIANSQWQFQVRTAEKNHMGQWFTVDQPVEMNFLTEFRLEIETNNVTIPEIVDFTYKRIPKNLESWHVFLHNNDPINFKRTIFKPDFEIKPSLKKKYGFFGLIRFGGVEGRRIVCQEKLEHDLRYIGEENGYYVFKLQRKYGSHKNFIGCSGAPIIDNDNNLIALVAFGDRKTNCIYGVNIARYKSSLDIEANPNF